MTWELIVLLALVVVAAAAAFYAGWSASHAHLSSAIDVTNVTNTAIKQANERDSAIERVTAALDKNTAATASLAEQVKAASEASSVGYAKVEKALIGIFEGLERTGVVRDKRTLPRQVGERAPDA